MNRSVVLRLNLLTQLLALAAAVMAIVSFGGYLSGRRLLISGGTNLAGMSPITATCLLGLSIALVASVGRRAQLCWIATILTGAIALGTLVDRAMYGTDTISPVIGRILFHAAPDFTGRMSAATGLGIVLIAVSLASSRKWRVAADICTGTATTIAITALLGYASNVADLYAMPIFSTMAVNTAACLACLSIGTLLVQPFEADQRLPSTSPIATALQLCGIMAIPILTSCLLLSNVSFGLLSNALVLILVMLGASLPASLFIVRDARLLASQIEEDLRPASSSDIGT